MGLDAPAAGGGDAGSAPRAGGGAEPYVPRVARLASAKQAASQAPIDLQLMLSRLRTATAFNSRLSPVYVQDALQKYMNA
jgi:hypothetical protein